MAEKTFEERIKMLHAELLRFAILNYSLPSEVAQAKAVGMIHAAVMLREDFTDIELPDASLTDLRHVRGIRTKENPSEKSLSRQLPHHLRQVLGRYQQSSH